MSITKKNHYNPCFWTAYWNYQYYHNEEYRRKNSPRIQKIYSLNIKADNIFPTITEKVFYEKRMGLAEIKDDVILDFENFFTIQENSAKSVLIKVIKQNNIESLEEKTWIASFIYDLMIRHYENFNSLVDKYISNGKNKIDFLIDLNNDYSSTEFHKSQIIPLIASEWSIYLSKEFKFPLGDNPILINNKNILLAISPKMLLKINYKKHVTPEKICEIKHKMSCYTYRNFVYRTITSSNREIIFDNIDVLEKWRKSKVYLKKVKN
ncbi:hypothetical protein ACJD0Z_02110 [Flavobacteriaceae bacterium M23B6Z8]